MLTNEHHHKRLCSDQNISAPAISPHGVPPNINAVLTELGIEPTLTVQEAAYLLRWSYSKARRYFSQVHGICVSYRPKRYKRTYVTFTIPLSVFAREWQKMTGREPESPEIIRQRLAHAVRMWESEPLS